VSTAGIGVRALGRVQLHNCMADGDCIQVVAHSCEETQAGESERVPIGRPIANTQVYVLDEQLGPRAGGGRRVICCRHGAGARVSESPGDGTALRSEPFGARQPDVSHGDRVRYLQTVTCSTWAVWITR